MVGVVGERLSSEKTSLNVSCQAYWKETLDRLGGSM